MKTSLLLNALLFTLGVAAAQKCGDPKVKSVCGACDSVVTCEGGAEGAATHCSGKKKYCTYDAATKKAKCVPEDDKTIDPVCKCDKGKLREDICDLYDDAKIRMCSGGSYVTTATCPGDRVCTQDPGNPDLKTCGEDPQCDATNAWVTTNAECTSYAFCMGGETTLPHACELGDVYDEAQQKCVTPPFKPCTGYCVDGLCADVSDCKKRHLCLAGVFHSDHFCTETAPYFDYKTMTCAKNSDVCHPLTKCQAPTTGSSGKSSNPGSDPAPDPASEVAPPPSSACTPNTAYQIWPDPEECRGYYRCLPTESGSYAMARGKCSGRLEFNSAKNQCDLMGEGDCPKN